MNPSRLPLIKEIDYIDSEQILLRLAHEPGLCFLDSAKQQTNLGRYSYLAIDPFLIINSKSDLITVDNTVFSGNPFDVLQTQLQHYRTTPVDHIPPFQGGALGYFGYDLLHHLENIPKPAQDDIAVPDLYLGFYDCVIAFDHQLHQVWIISQGFPEIDIEQRQQRAIHRAEWLSQKIFGNTSTPIKLKEVTDKKFEIASNFTKANYCKAIQKTIDYVYAGDIFEANISQCFSSSLPNEINPIDLYVALRKQNATPFSAFINFGEVSIASASPERFIHLQNGIIETRPIKGTRARGQTADDDERLANELLNSDKDNAENIMIVDLMRNDLSRVCKPNSIIVTQLCGLESYETVHHLVSAIEASLDPKYNAIDLLKATFPGGSITGAPKVRAMEIIYEIEPLARGVYCGSIGYIGFDGNMDTSVVIRTYTIKQSRVYIQAGGGIVAESDPQSEYEESITKAYLLKKILQVLWEGE